MQDPLSSSEESGKPLTTNKKAGEALQSRLFRGEAIYRDEDDAILEENDKLDDKIRKHQDNLAVDDGADLSLIDSDDEMDEGPPIGRRSWIILIITITILIPNSGRKLMEESVRILRKLW